MEKSKSNISIRCISIKSSDAYRKQKKFYKVSFSFPQVDQNGGKFFLNYYLMKKQLISILSFKGNIKAFSFDTAKKTSLLFPMKKSSNAFLSTKSHPPSIEQYQTGNCIDISSTLYIEEPQKKIGFMKIETVGEVSK